VQISGAQNQPKKSRLGGLHSPMLTTEQPSAFLRCPEMALCRRVDVNGLQSDVATRGCIAMVVGIVLGGMVRGTYRLEEGYGGRRGQERGHGTLEGQPMPSQLISPSHNRQEPTTERV
jgi:hypothetical protein